MIKKTVPYCRHNIDEADISAVVQVLNGEWLTQGPVVEEFENSLERLIGAPVSVVSSGTAALHSVFSVMGLETGDEIISTPNTFVATHATAMSCGAKIVFADIESDTGNIDLESVRSLITPRTRAVVAVDFAGHPCDLDKLRELTELEGVQFIEDAAHSLGSRYKGDYVGSQADFTTFSFFATKNIATGEGGAVSSRNNFNLAKIKRFSRQGVERRLTHLLSEPHGPWYYEVQSLGLNYRLPDILCALGNSQLSKLDLFKKFRSQLFQLYYNLFVEFDFLELPTQRDYADPMWHLFPLRFPSEIRRQVCDKFRAAGLFVQVNYIPAYFHPIFDRREYPIGICPRAEEFYSREISLPMFVDNYLLTDEYLNRIYEVINEFA